MPPILKAKRSLIKRIRSWAFPYPRLCFEGAAGCFDPDPELSASHLYRQHRQHSGLQVPSHECESRTTKYTAGLSLGECSALVVSGALSFEDGLRLVKKRAELMEAGAKISRKMSYLFREGIYLIMLKLEPEQDYKQH